MAPDATSTVFYKRSTFVTHLPIHYRYSPSHAWLAEQPDGTWQVGLTKFAVRMLGDMVDHGFEIEPGSAVAVGQIVGWIEGFKAISDLFCVVEGQFLGGNSQLKQALAQVNRDCYGAGWIYRAQGQPDPRSLNVHEYLRLLDKTIDKILERQKQEAAPADGASATEGQGPVGS